MSHLSPFSSFHLGLPGNMEGRRRHFSDLGTIQCVHCQSHLSLVKAIHSIYLPVNPPSCWAPIAASSFPCQAPPPLLSPPSLQVFHVSRPSRSFPHLPPSPRAQGSQGCHRCLGRTPLCHLGANRHQCHCGLPEPADGHRSAGVHVPDIAAAPKVDTVDCQRPGPDPPQGFPSHVEIGEMAQLGDHPWRQRGVGVGRIGIR